MCSRRPVQLNHDHFIVYNEKKCLVFFFTKWELGQSSRNKDKRRAYRDDKIKSLKEENET